MIVRVSFPARQCCLVSPESVALPLNSTLPGPRILSGMVFGEGVDMLGGSRVEWNSEPTWSGSRFDQSLDLSMAQDLERPGILCLRAMLQVIYV